MDIKKLHLSAPVQTALKRNGITTVEKLAGISPKELAALPHLGKKRLKEIEEALERWFKTHIQSHLLR